MNIQHLGLLVSFLLLASGVEIKYIKYCGPKDETFHVNVTPWPVLTAGHRAKVTATFTPHVDVYYSTMSYIVTTKDGKVVFKEVVDPCRRKWFPKKFCLLPAGEKVSWTHTFMVRTFAVGIEGTYKGRVELYNQDRFMWMCLEGEVIY